MLTIVNGQILCMQVQETWVPSLGWEELLEKGMATQSSTVAWRIPQTEEPVGYSSRGGKGLDMSD